ncbi:hypothetical protein CLOACE_04330 [Clostridium acetireducens DSM 10703]|uniref:Uncharacterized protein n=1 Tax=Clostridium acetireducens DSM 10703 TaxID=1121290 RepID=A0A1E8F199_9CLOT|nr:hypothetical protein [Clostridium acetireducens]OFI07241.1 hypothetical protein CLOACE_04330 [Clostridium acetireducens DSM 10703]
MSNFVDDLKNTKVLNKNDIIRFKIYIDKKFYSLDKKARADILSNTIHKVLNNFLKGLDNNSTSQLKIEILNNTLVKEKYNICMYDIFFSYIQLNKNISNCNVNELLDWINNYSENKITIDTLNKHFNIPDNNLNMDFNEENITLTNNTVEKQQVSNYKKTKSKNKKLSNTKMKTILPICILIFIVNFSVYINKSFKKNKEDKSIVLLQKFEKDLTPIGTKIKGKKINPNFPQYLKYRKINEKNLKDFLVKRNSLLAKEPYFSAIILSAKEFNLNPIILFSITGQEQNFVPINSKYANKIANNPFNVFHSWEEYNTDIKDSSEIAARTVLNLCSDMPKDADPFKWVNRKYAEDTNWWKGVESFFKELDKLTK